MYKYNMYLIETLTNTHVGSGESGMGTIDNMIQRDPVSSVPVFHSSSIKGALRDHCEENELDEAIMRAIFGVEGVLSAEEEDKEKKKSRPGDFIFFPAQLLTIPLRATRNVYYNCASPRVLEDFIDFLKDFTGEDVGSYCKYLEETKNSLFEKAFMIFEEAEDLEIEDYGLTSEGYLMHETEEECYRAFFKFLKKIGIPRRNFALFNDEIFKQICETNIPVIARNCIGEDGTSKNLFYEEVLPRRSKLWFMMGYPQDSSKNLDALEGKILFAPKNSSKNIVQFGADKSVGYGVCKIDTIAQTVKKEVESEQ